MMMMMIEPARPVEIEEEAIGMHMHIMPLMRMQQQIRGPSIDDRCPILATSVCTYSLSPASSCSASLCSTSVKEKETSREERSEVAREGDTAAC